MTDDDGKNIFSGPEGDALMDRFLKEVRALGSRRGTTVDNIVLIATEKKGASVYGDTQCNCPKCKLNIVMALASSLGLTLSVEPIDLRDAPLQPHVH